MHTRADVHTNIPGTLKFSSAIPKVIGLTTKRSPPPRAGSVFQAFPHPVRLPRASSPTTGSHVAAWPREPTAADGRPRAVVRSLSPANRTWRGPREAPARGGGSIRTAHRPPKPARGPRGKPAEERKPQARPRQHLRRWACARARARVGGSKGALNNLLEL